MTSALTLDEFPPVSTEQWNEVVRADLKGVAPKTKLFYRAEDLAGLDYPDAAPGAFPYTRGTRATNDWTIRQTVDDLADAQAALDAGADEINFVLGDHDVHEVLDALPACPVHFEAGGRAAELLPALAGRQLRGSVDYEPLADFDRAAELIRAAQSLQFKPATVRAFRFSEAGASAVQELAFALAEGIEILDHIPDAAPAMAFSFAIGPNYFLEIARLRAARTLWARVCESFGIDAQAAKMTICARTAHWTKSIYDAHVNLLRATTEAMAAAIGGADALQVEPFDNTYRAADETSRRLARNTQLILKREALLDRTVDAAGGAYYLESLTDSVAREVWTLLQEIEAAGGFLKYPVGQGIAKSRADREAAVSTRRTTIVGTNQYPNLAERMLPKIESTDPAPRPARIFEEIRLRTERCGAPRFLLLEAGDLKMRKARSAFITNFLGCAGFEMQISDTLAGEFDAVVLCSSDPEYAKLAPRVIEQLRAAGKNTPVIVAGNPTESLDQLKQAGVADFIHIRSNAAEVLRAWQDRLGVTG
jgi:methylmalonyl-CoA mutase